MKIYHFVGEIKDQDLLLLQEEHIDSQEMNIMKEQTLKKIGQERRKDATKVVPKKRIAVLVAAVMCIVVLGTIAYATELFGLGEVKYMGQDVTVSAMEDSEQYKAMKEYRDYVEGFSYKTQEKLGKDHFIRKEKALSDKYGLVYESQKHYVKTAKEAMEQAGVNNFLGEFQADKGQFSYGDFGTVSMVLDKGRTYFDLFCYPQNVFYGVLPFANLDEDQSERMEWEYETKSKDIAKCVSYKYKYGESNQGDTENVYEVMIMTEKYTIVMCIANTTVQSKEQLENIIDLFDFSVLK